MKIGSSAVKMALLRGDVGLANRMLGRPYTIEGLVVRGRGLGRKLGFPTVNFKPSDRQRLIPANGVYAARSIMGEKEFPGLLYIGRRPTIERRGRLSIEFHSIGGPPPSIIGRAEVQMLGRLRPERRFRSRQELVRAMARDAGRARLVLGLADRMS
jgi:riboflavin kinase/FMN adenylyltransferase